MAGSDLGTRSPALDGLRGVAALSVLIFHVWLYSMPNPNLSARTSLLDYVAVELKVGLVLFFVLSGFLIYRPWLLASIGERSRPNLLNYLKRRATRILPAYYVALSGSVLLLWSNGDTPGVRLPPSDSLPLFAVFGQNFTEATVMKLNPPVWTLSVEACFYLLVPIVGAAALSLGKGSLRQLTVPAALLTIGVVWNWSIAGRDLPLTFTKVLPAMLPYFAVGMVAALIVAHTTVPKRTARALLALGAIAVVSNALWHSLEAASGSHALTLHIVRDLPAAAGFAALLVAVVASPGKQTGVLSQRPLTALGTVSYGVYLWHIPLMLWIRSQGLLPANELAALAIVLPVTLVAASCSWFLVERPVIRLAMRRQSKDRWISHRQPTRAGTKSTNGERALAYQSSSN